ncbi:MAG: glycosyltransferase family 39 protein [Bacteroidota bacterium]|nr:glycosyltransferase family 39 protein [Bacteroidota bacterium]MDP4233916.1 glycosyltransferase family 39 protein [Bacteroidota bacterium]MDP4242834.1 glycosyltransferase family 39 protein [Bacteroidota bacterium]MDP4288312.1 glycosyltransferase family 39 protein [Bacteroidota bacterium]
MSTLTRIAKIYRVEAMLALGAIAVCILFGCTQQYFLDGHTAGVRGLLSPPLDDVYIHCQFAHNLLSGGPYGFANSVPLTADTSPLWVVLIAIGGLFTSRLELVAIVLSMICFAIIPIGIYRTARDLFGLEQQLSILAGALAILTGRIAWSGMSGMETALAALLMLLAVEEHLRSRRTACIRAREAIWLGLGVLTRPEFIFVASVFAIDWIVASVREHPNVKAAPIVVLTFVAISSPAILLPIVTRGSLLFHSSVVQGAHASLVPNVLYLWFVLKIMIANNIILLALAGYGVWKCAKDARIALLLIIIIGLPLAQAFVAPQFRHHGRYMFPVLPLIPLVAVSMLAVIAPRMSTPANRIVMAVIIFASLVETYRWSRISAESVRNINDQHLMAVDWLRQNMRPTDTLAVQDVGAIGYFLDKPVIDLTGLVTPSIWPVQHDQDSVWRAARKMGANLFVIYNRLNPTYFLQHSDSLVLATEFRVRLPLASSADTVMSVYRLKETRHG